MTQLNSSAIEQLEKLGEMTGRNLLGELSKIYFSTTPDLLKKMSELLAEKSYEELGREAHSLKSSSANLGAAEMSEICQAIEYHILENGESSSEQELQQLVEKAQQTCQPTLDAMSQLAAVAAAMNS